MFNTATYAFIDGVSDFKKKFVEQTVQHEGIKTAMNTFVDAQSKYTKAAADAAKAKSGFQQTAADKLAIKAAADKGIREAKEKKKKLKKKVVAEFKSNFLGMII